ncbi:MAG: hypothetical protein ACP5G1_04250 [Nanopusillaceae archaeon]
MERNFVEKSGKNKEYEFIVASVSLNAFLSTLESLIDNNIYARYLILEKPVQNRIGNS